eukprot:m.1266078 g.1266078  ORF g.1266078 m.1266078 type:complete len:690 (-) comp24740_c0_seq5:2123-4192(-)
MATSTVGGGYGAGGSSMIDVHGIHHGKIWQRSSVRPLDHSGSLLHVQHSRHGQTPLGSQLLRFTHVSFNRAGTSFTAVDQLGNLYDFNIAENRFKHVCKMDTTCTAMQHAVQDGELLVGLADNSFRLFSLISTAHGSADAAQISTASNTSIGDVSRESPCICSAVEHRTCIQIISVNSSGKCALTTSMDETLLWNLDDFTIVRTLHGAGDVGLQQAIFSSCGDAIFTCFKNDEIFAWDAATFKIAFKMHPPKPQHTPQLHFKSMVCSRDDRVLVAGGRSRALVVWNLSTGALQRTVWLPTPTSAVRAVQCVWTGHAPADQTVAALTDTGQVYLVDVQLSALLCTVGAGGTSTFIDTIATGLHGRCMATVSSRGVLSLHDIDECLTEALHHPRPLAPSAPVSTAASFARGQRSATDHAAHPPGAPGSAPRGKNNGNRGKYSMPRGNHTKGLSRKRIDEHRTQVQKAFSTLREDRLADLLNGYGEYPAKYRKYIWKQLLQLPENTTVYQHLLDKGTHSAFAQFHQVYPMKSRKLLRIAQRNLSALAHWAPIMGEVSYLPHLVFPFFKYFENTPFASFEIVLTVLINWCQQWFEFFPNPPINVSISLCIKLGLNLGYFCLSPPSHPLPSLFYFYISPHIFPHTACLCGADIEYDREHPYPPRARTPRTPASSRNYFAGVCLAAATEYAFGCV